MGPKAKIFTLGERALKLPSLDSSQKKQAIKKKCQNWMKNNRVMPISGSLPILGQNLAILATFLKYIVFPIIYIKINRQTK